MNFIVAEDSGGAGDNWSYTKCKAPAKLSPPSCCYTNIVRARKEKIYTLSIN